MGGLRKVLIGLVGLMLGSAVHAAGTMPKADFPPNWQDWPVVKEGRFPAEGASLKDLPPIVRETFKTYAWINDGQGSPYAIRIHPEKRGDQGYGSGPTAVLEIKELGVILVTGHLRGVVSVYGIYTADGKDISGTHPSLKLNVCRGCHASHGPNSSGRFGCEKGICSQ